MWKQPCQYKHCTSFNSQVTCKIPNMFSVRAQLFSRNTEFSSETAFQQVCENIKSSIGAIQIWCVCLKLTIKSYCGTFFMLKLPSSNHSVNVLTPRSCIPGLLFYRAFNFKSCGIVNNFALTLFKTISRNYDYDPNYSLIIV